MQARKRLAEHEAEMGDLRSEFQEFLQADEGKLTQMARLLASIQDLQQERDSLKSQLTEAYSSSEVAQPMSRLLDQGKLMHCIGMPSCRAFPCPALLCVPQICRQHTIKTMAG